MINKMKKSVAILITALINVERDSNGLLPVRYDFELHDVLRAHNVTDSWYYQESGRVINWTISGQNRYCSINGCFYEPLNNTYLFRETYKDSIAKIFRYRLGQRDCNKTDFVDGMPCSWKYVYYDALMMPELKSFACKSLNYQGTWTPTWLLGRQKKSFWCYSNTKPFYWK